MNRLGLTSTAAEEAMRLARGATDAFTPAMSGAIAQAMREQEKFIELAGGYARDLAATDNALCQASGMVNQISKATAGDFSINAVRDAMEKNAILDGVLEKTGSLADALGNLKTLHGIDDKTLAGIKDNLASYDTASSILEQELAKSKLNDPLGFREIEMFNPPIPELPPIPPNPIHDTNRLLDEVIESLVDQRSLIEASAEAQKQETELLGKLVEAFMTSQAASDKAARRSHMQAWIGIGVAIATGIIPVIILLVTGH